MTTDSEQRVRALLETAAPEPRRAVDGAAIRTGPEDASDELLTPRRTPRAATLSVVLAAAAVLVVALAVVGLFVRSGGDKASPASPVGERSRSHQIAPPDWCTNDTTVFEGGRFVGLSGGKGTNTLVIRNEGKRKCTFRHLPAIALTVDNVVVSRLPASSYRPTRPVVIGAHSSVRIVVLLDHVHGASSCGGSAEGRTRITFTTDGFGYGFDQSIDGCRYVLASAHLRS